MDCLLAGQAARREKDLAGFRLIAVQVYNALAEKPLAATDYLPLPAVDGLPATGPAAGSHAEWKARMKEKHGAKLES